ncbi:DUF2793 domain-containing protein [Phyllobacterium zundukense]|jgi:hypothetical protein|uniref:DUF2793 domain-containing protein n=1 Tax=Phyllobacterium zundukense TaxID=1867719 RepID=A0ACD4D4W0_9HYPH|nr:DUF2793 domain-containing protein [Phyllobacterium zundukense]UXN60845.1 DUF2793 domain-containing protein [Phyllobacterium zundukense]
MDQTTTNLKLPYIAPSQAQKHVTHNEAIRALDALVQLSVMSRKLKNAPPESSEGDRYIIASEAVVPWAGKTDQIAAWQDDAWAFLQPQEGWHAWVAEEQTFVVFERNSWRRVTTGTNPVDSVGINTVADENNRLALKSPASLFDHIGGGHQLKINKADDGHAASLLFQSNYQGRAEMGTMWGRDFHIKTSSDGDHWQDAVAVDSTTGIVRFPSGIAHSATGKKQSGLIFVPPSDTGTVIFQPLGVRAQALKTAKLASISADIVTFTSNTAGEFFGAAMRGLSMVRIWNATKTPALPAFAKWDTAANQLQVSNADDVKLWSEGDTIQLGDPVTNLIAIDVSPLMQKLLGSVFRQDGLLLDAGNTGTITVACSDHSPASASNLVYFKMDETRSFSLIGVYG